MSQAMPSPSAPLRKIALAFHPTSPWEIDLTRGILRFAQDHNWQFHGLGPMMIPLTSLERWDGDGVISIVKNEGDLKTMADLDLPVVDVAGAARHPKVLRVLNDDFESGYKVGEHLKSRLFRHVFYCGVEELGWSQKRREGLIKSLQPRLLGGTFLRPLNWWESNQSCIKLMEWLKSLPASSAVVCCHDSAAVKVSQACRLQDLEVPRDLAIIGFDNNDVLCKLNTPSLSSADIDVENLGYKAAEVLHLAMNRHPVSHETLLPAKDVVERDSTRLYHCNDEEMSKAMILIQQKACSGLTIKELLQDFQMSRRSFELRFQKAFGVSPRRAIINIRFERSKDLLIQNELKIHEIADQLGYQSPECFFTMFKKYFGQTPKAFRENNSVDFAEAKAVV